MSSDPHSRVFHFLRDRWFRFANPEQLHLATSKNPWARHPKGPGAQFYENVLSSKPPTVEEAIGEQAPEDWGEINQGCVRAEDRGGERLAIET